MMSAYVFSIALDLALNGRDSGVANLKKIAPREVPANKLNFQLEFLALTMAPFTSELQMRYDRDVADGITRGAVDRLTEFCQEHMTKKADPIDWVTVPVKISNSVHFYANQLTGISQVEDLIRLSRIATERLLGKPDPFLGAAIADHVTRSVQFARNFLTAIPLAG
jgi:hypothetical protein